MQKTDTGRNFESTPFATDGLLRNALESSPDCIQIVDLAGRIQFVNRSGAVLLGVGEASLLDVPWPKLWAEADQGAAQAALLAAAGGEPQRFMAQTPAASGAARHFDSIVSPLRDDSAQTVALLVTSRDVTELEQARLAAEERERQAALQAAVQRSAAQMVKLGGWEIDLRAETLVLTDETIRLFGGPREAPLEEHLRTAYEPDDITRIMALLEGARTRGEAFSYGAAYKAPNGSAGWLRALGEPVYEDGVCVAIRGAVLDISDEKAAQATIERAEQRLLMALQLAGVRVYDMDLEQRSMTHYGSATSLDGPEPTFEDFWPPPSERVVHALDIERVRAEWALAEETRTPFRSEFRVVRTDGEERWSFCVAELMRDASGHPLRMLAAVMDITERKRNELENLQTMAKMREHETRQKLLMGELNHRVKNTLASVQSVATQTLTDAHDIGEARDLFVERLLSLSATHNLLVKHGWESASLRELVEMTLKPYGRAYGYRGPDLRLDPNFAVSLGMALHELATNAIKHGAWTGAGRVMIEVTASCLTEACIVWRESGGPQVGPPTRRGFGSRLLQRGVAAELGGQVTLDFAGSGLVCTIRAPLSTRLQVLQTQPELEPA